MDDKLPPKPPGLEDIDADPAFLWELFTDRGGPDYEEPGWNFSARPVIDAELGEEAILFDWRGHMTTIFRRKLSDGRVIRNSWYHDRPRRFG